MVEQWNVRTFIINFQKLEVTRPLPMLEIRVRAFGSGSPTAKQYSQINHLKNKKGIFNRIFQGRDFIIFFEKKPLTRYFWSFNVKDFTNREHIQTGVWLEDPFHIFILES